MDPNIDLFIPTLLKNTGHTNNFIAKESEIALVKACENCNETRITNACLSLKNVRTNVIK